MSKKRGTGLGSVHVYANIPLRFEHMPLLHLERLSTECQLQSMPARPGVLDGP